MLKELLCDGSFSDVSNGSCAAAPAESPRVVQHDSLAAAPAKASETETSERQLAGLHLPNIRKLRSPASADAPLRRQVLAQAGEGVPLDRLHQFHTMALSVDAGEIFTASSHLYGGTYGRVGLAIDGAGQPWAVKVMHTQPSNDVDTEVTRPEDFAKELTFTQKYVSSNAYAAADQNGEIYLFLPLQCASAHDTAKALRQSPAAHRAVIRSVGAQVAQGLAFMHGQGDVMLDLKPGNIMIDRAGYATMSDFGESRHIVDMQASIAADDWNKPGTELFSAPELHRAFNAGTPLTSLPALDVWSFGMALLDMTSELRGGPFKACVPFQSSAVLDDYFAWRTPRMGSTGFDMAHLDRPLSGEDPRGFTAYFQSVAAQDPDLCHLLLSDILVPGDVRADAATAHQRLLALQPESSDEAALAHHTMVVLGKQATAQAAVLDALHARQAHAYADISAGHATPHAKAAIDVSKTPSAMPTEPKPLLLRLFEFVGLSIETED